MTIAIAPILAKLPAQGASADSAMTTDRSATGNGNGNDFSSLLLGQLAAGADLQPGIPIGNLASLPITNLPATDLPDTTAAPQDAAMLLASLGMAPPQQNGKAATVAMDTDTLHLRVGNDKKASALPSATPLAGATANPDAALLEASPETGATPQGGLSAAFQVGDKAAKFAVQDFTGPKIDAFAAKSLTNEAGTTQTPVAATLAPNQSATTTTISSTPLRVDTPVRDPAWSGDFSQKVVWLTTNDQKFAQLTLNPPQMGPIEISLNINKDTASAYFVSPNAEVREAIETALPRLREMLAGVGIELGQANVSAQSSRQEAGNQEARPGAPRWLTDAAILDDDLGRSQAIIAQRGNGLVDTFA